MLNSSGRQDPAPGIDRRNDADLLEPGWREGWCHVNDVDLHVIEAGRSGDPVVVLLHGFPEFWWAWRHQITALAEAGYHVVVPDLRGYNLSSAPRETSAYQLDQLIQDVVGLAGELGADTFYLVGHDWGAVIGWCVAARHGERVKRAVLISGPHPEACVEQVFTSPAQAMRSAYIAFFQMPLLPETILSALGFARLKAALRRSARRETFAPSVLERYAVAWARPGSLSGMVAYYRACAQQKRAELLDA